MVVTDMTMPIMDGLMTGRILRKVNPKVWIIISSGLVVNEQDSVAAHSGLERFLPKPFTVGTLRNAVRNLPTGECAC